MKIPLIVLTTAFSIRLAFPSPAPGQDLNPLEEDPLPQQSPTESLYPEDAATESLIPESSDFPFDTEDLEIPTYEEIPMPEVEEFVVPESKLKKEFENKTRLFEARTKASVDPGLQAELRRAQQVKTYPERRQAMFNYYMGLYNKMLRMEPELEELILSEREAELKQLKQTRIRPSTWPVPPPDFPVVIKEEEDESSR